MDELLREFRNKAIRENTLIDLIAKYEAWLIMFQTEESKKYITKQLKK